MSHLVETTKKKIMEDNSIVSSNKNKAIILQLHGKGVFNFKDSVQFVANALNISKNTVYLHLRKL